MTWETTTTTRARGIVLASALMAVTLLTACTSGTATSSPAATTTKASATASTTAAPPLTGTPLPAVGTPAANPATATTLGQRCGVGGDAPLLTLTSTDGSKVAAANIGTGGTVALYFHQNEDSLCGWAQFATLAAQHGVHGLLVDFCGFGQSTCTPAVTADPAAQVALAVDWAKANGATRITLVGASMGGSIALANAAKVKSDAVVDISGPYAWKSVPDAVTSATPLTQPLLIAAATADSDVSPELLQAAVEASASTHKVFLKAASGHGWQLLSDGAAPGTLSAIGARALQWINGDYAG